LSRFILFCGFLLFLAAGLSACVEGSLSEAFVDPALAASYMNLKPTSPPLNGPGGAAFVVAPRIAVTNAHNSNLVAGEDILARSSRLDILFFRTTRTQAVRIAQPRIGQEVVAYGHGGNEERREAQGSIEVLPVTPENCPACPPETGFGYRAPGGPGFSGGPVTDAETGAVLGITFAFIESPLESGESRLMLAHSMAQIRSEMEQLLP
jgi:S1-C subfamily serine protease